MSHRLYGSTWSITLSTDTRQKILRQGTGIGLVGAEDLGIKARKALVELGFAKEDLPTLDPAKKAVRFETPLSELEESMWQTFDNWIDTILWLDEDSLRKTSK